MLLQYATVTAHYPSSSSVLIVVTVLTWVSHRWCLHFNAFKACIDKFWQHQLVKFDFTADLTGTGNRSEEVIEWYCSFMIVYNHDADLEVSDACVRNSLLSWVTQIFTGRIPFLSSEQQRRSTIRETKHCTRQQQWKFTHWQSFFSIHPPPDSWRIDVSSQFTDVVL